MEASGGSVCGFIRKPTKTAKNIRKRRTIEEHEESDSPTDSVESSSLKTNDSSQRKSSTHENNSLYFSTPAGSGRNIFQFESSKNVPAQDDSWEAAPLEPEFSGDERAIRERALKRAKKDLMRKGGGGAEKLYRGSHGYRDHKAGFRREQRIGKVTAGGAHGPLRASAHIRVTARFDYQPDVCKNYKETGYCGYGDSCKFMHDRGDYKSGWQLEKEWEEAEKKAGKRNLGLGKLDDDDEEEEEEEGDSLPFACSICRQPFEEPVVTKCKHYFCGHCALKHHEKKKKCFVCNQPTLGNFNSALELRKRMVEHGKQ